MNDHIFETLFAARKLIAESYALRSIDANGFTTSSARDAVAFSMMHAIEKSSSNEETRSDSEWALRRVWGKMPRRPEYDSLWHWETMVGKDAVLDLVDATIASLDEVKP